MLWDSVIFGCFRNVESICRINECTQSYDVIGKQTWWLIKCIYFSECFDFLKKQLPAQADEKKTSNLSILHSALRFIQNLKRKERELEHEMERLARDKIAAQQRLAVLKKEIAAQCDVDISALLPEQLQTPVITSSEKVQEPAPPPPPPPPVIERVPIPHIPKPQPIPNGIKEVIYFVHRNFL